MLLLLILPPDTCPGSVWVPGGPRPVFRLPLSPCSDHCIMKFSRMAAPCFWFDFIAVLRSMYHEKSPLAKGNLFKLFEVSPIPAAALGPFWPAQAPLLRFLQFRLLPEDRRRRLFPTLLLDRMMKGLQPCSGPSCARW